MKYAFVPSRPRPCVLLAAAILLMFPAKGLIAAPEPVQVRTLIGVGEPARGSFFQLQRLPSGSAVKTDDFMEMLPETEVAFTIGKRMDRLVESLAALKPFIRQVHGAFDFGAHHFVVEPAMDPAKVDVDGLTLKLARDGVVIREGPAREVLGSPWNSLLWLVNDVVKRGRSLEPGEVVSTGTAALAHRAKGVEIKGAYEGECAPLGRVALEIK